MAVSRDRFGRTRDRDGGGGRKCWGRGGEDVLVP